MGRALKKTQPKIKHMNYEAQLWCFKNGYRIFPILVKAGYNIRIERGGNTFVATTIYKEAEIWQEIWNTYQTIYNKHGSKKTKE